MVIGALIVKHKLCLNDRETVAMISESPYLQYFCGLQSFQVNEPFHPTVFVDIRKRMGVDRFDKWNRLIIEKADSIKPKRKQQIDSSDQNHNQEETTNNKGKLKIDATVADQKITFPADAKLLNSSREESERIIDILYKQIALTKKPRDYRRVARKEFVNFSKTKRKSKKQIRKFIGKQLRYLKRNFSHIEKLLDHITELKRKELISGALFAMKNPFPERFPSSKRDQKIYWVIQHIYRQQRYMYDNKVHSVPDRIVNIYQPYVRPVVRGKDKGNTEFGAKISASEVEGFTTTERISWDAFNEAIDLKLQAKAFKRTYGHWPEVLLADQIYLNRENRKWLKQRNIKIVGKPLGRPPKQKLSAYHKRKQRKLCNQRNHIEGKFGQGKNAYGLSKIKAKRSDTSKSWIAAIFFVMNLVKLEKIAKKYAIFLALLKKTLLNVILVSKRYIYHIEKTLTPRVG